MRLSEEIFIPVAIDAVRPIDGEEMVRVTYFVVTTDAPGSVWEVELPPMVELHGIGLVGMAGVVYSTVRRPEADEEMAFDLFTKADDIASIFTLEAPGSPFSIQVEDVWMPLTWFEGTGSWDESDTSTDSHPVRGDVFRVGVEAFREAYRYTAGDVAIDQLMEVGVDGQVLRSPIETRALHQWSQDQIDAARRAFPDQPLKLRWRAEADA